MFGGKCVRIGAVVVAGLGMTVVAGLASSDPVGALPTVTSSSSGIPELAVGGTGPVGFDLLVWPGDTTIPFSISVTLSDGLVVATDPLGGSDGDCSGVTFTGTAGSHTMVVAGSASNPLPVLEAGHCDVSFLVTSVTPGTATASFDGLYGPGPVSIDVSGPSITGITPSSGAGAGGSKVTVTGAGFSGATAVEFGTTPATHVKVAKGGRSLTAVVPPGTGSQFVAVTSPADGADPPGMYQMDYPSGVATYTNQFTYLAPTISSVAPSSGPTTGGRKVTIKGTDLQGAAVTIGGTAAAGVTVNRAGTSLRAEVPVGSAGPATVEVTTPAGSATAAYTYTA